MVKRWIAFPFMFLLFFGIQSCSNLKSGNFLKQKFLHGNLKTVYGEDCSDEKDVLEDYVPENIELVEFRSDGDAVLSEEQAVTEVVLPDEDFYEPSRSIESLIKKQKQKSFFRKGQADRFRKGGGSEAAFSWVIILLLLGLLSLFLFFVISWWAFLVAGLFFIAAMLLVPFIKPPKPRGRGGFIGGMVMVLVLIILVSILAALFILFLIIYGIVLLILLIFN